MRHTLAAAFLAVMGFTASGCGDSATVNPVVELASLTVTPGTLQPAFSGGTTQYNVELSNAIASVTITAQPAVAGDTVTINGRTAMSSIITLGAPGTTTPVSIVVSESSTNSRTYTVLLVRADITGNNSLQNLTISPGTLTPSFDENIQAYTVNVDSNVGSITVTPTLSDIAASMMINGQISGSGQARTVSLNSAGQTTTFSIVVTAQNGSKKTYFLAVSRGVSGNNSLRNLTISPGTLSPTFGPGTVGYRVNVASNVTSVTVTATLQDTTASMAVNGQATNSGEARSVPLNGPGSNNFVNIVVAAQNGTQKTYSINVSRGALAGNNDLSALDVSPGPLEPSFHAETLSYVVDTASTVGSVTVSATKTDPNAVMSGDVTAGAGVRNGSTSIPLGGPGTSRVVSITVTAPSGSAKTYRITVEREAQASNNNLKSLAVSPGPLTPAFTASRTRYTVNVGSDVASITMTAIPQDPNAGLAINGQGASAGQARNISLGAEGSTTNISIRVTPPNGNAKTYRITVEREAQASNNNLQSLSVSPGPLAPAFTASRTRYTVNVGSNVTSITVTAVPQDPNAGLAINGQGTNSGQARDISLGAEGSSTNISIRVNPPNGNAKTYRVTATRASEEGGGNNGGNGNNRGNGSNRGNGNNGGRGNDGDKGDEEDEEEDDDDE